MRDPHVVLGVAPGVDLDALARAFRSQAKRHHPDKNPHDPEAAARFRAVVAAYQELCRVLSGQAARPEPIVRVQCLASKADLYGTLTLPVGSEGAWLLVQIEAPCPCPACGGTGEDHVAGSWGRVEIWECEKCRGSGVRRMTRRLRVRVPDPYEPGERLRLAGMGLPGADGTAGDAILVLRR